VRGKIAIAVVAAALLVAAGSAQAAPQTTVVTVGDLVLGGAPGCVFTVSGPLFDASGTPTGNVEACVKSFEFSTEPFYSQTIVSEVAYALPGGTIFATVDVHELFVTDTRATHTERGEITGGTGAYAGASGKIVGSGVLVFDAAGGVHPNLHIVIQIR
jgi:hypothetical protein